MRHCIARINLNLAALVFVIALLTADVIALQDIARVTISGADVMRIVPLAFAESLLLSQDLNVPIRITVGEAARTRVVALHSHPRFLQGISQAANRVIVKNADATRLITNISLPSVVRSQTRDRIVVEQAQAMRSLGLSAPVRIAGSVPMTNKQATSTAMPVTPTQNISLSTDSYFTPTSERPQTPLAPQPAPDPSPAVSNVSEEDSNGILELFLSLNFWTQIATIVSCVVAIMGPVAVLVRKVRNRVD